MSKFHEKMDALFGIYGRSAESELRDQIAVLSGKPIDPNEFNQLYNKIGPELDKALETFVSRNPTEQAVERMTQAISSFMLLVWHEAKNNNSAYGIERSVELIMEETKVQGHLNSLKSLMDVYKKDSISEKNFSEKMVQYFHQIDEDLGSSSPSPSPSLVSPELISETSEYFSSPFSPTLLPSPYRTPSSSSFLSSSSLSPSLLPSPYRTPTPVSARSSSSSLSPSLLPPPYRTPSPTSTIYSFSYGNILQQTPEQAALQSLMDGQFEGQLWERIRLIAAQQINSHFDHYQSEFDRLGQDRRLLKDPGFVGLSEYDRDNAIQQNVMREIELTLKTKLGYGVLNFLSKNPNPETIDEASEALASIGAVLAVSGAFAGNQKIVKTTDMLDWVTTWPDIEYLFDKFNTACHEYPNFQNVSGFQRRTEQAHEVLNILRDNIVPELKHQDKELRRPKRIAELQSQLEAPFVSTNKSTVKPISHFKYEREKSLGIEVGVIAKKKYKPQDDPSKEQYTYEWMIKHESPTDTAMGMMAADAFRYLLDAESAPKMAESAPKMAESAPKMRLVKNASGDVLLASRMLKKYHDLWDDYPHHTPDRRLNNQNQYDETRLPGLMKLMAAHAFLGSYDAHSSNIGVVEAPAGNRKPAVVDCSRSFVLVKGRDDFSKGSWSVPGVFNDLNNGDALTPTDMIRGIHGGHYKLNSSLFLNEAFAQGLEEIATRVENDPTAFSRVLKSSIKTINKTFRNLLDREQINNRLRNIGDGVTLDNMKKKLPEALMERVPMMKEFAQNIRLQLALLDNDHTKVFHLLDNNPELLTRKIKWLTSTDAEYAYPAMTVSEYALSIGSPMEISNAIRYAISNDLARLRNQLEGIQHPIFHMAPVALQGPNYWQQQVQSQKPSPQSIAHQQTIASTHHSWSQKIKSPSPTGKPGSLPSHG